MKEQIQRLFKADREDGFELQEALNAMAYFYLGWKEDTGHEHWTDDFYIFSSRYLLDREFEVPEKTSELYKFACDFSDSLKSEGLI